MDIKEMVDRYVFAVGEDLPAKQRHDISEELRSSIWDTLEDRFGPQPELEQAAELLKEFGPPEKVAASYWPAGQYLIGPELFPLYRTILNILVVVWLVGGVALAGLTFALGASIQLPEWLGGLFQGFMSMIGGLTIAFAILQRFGVKGDGNEQTFNPLKLPKVEHDELVNRAGQLVEFVVGVIVLALLTYLPSRLENFLPNTIILRLPAVEAVLGWIAASIIVSLVLNLILLVRGRWTLFARLVNIASNLFSMIIIGWILNSPSPLVAAGELGREVVEIAEMGVRIGLVVALVVLVIDTGVILYGLLKRHVLAPPVKDLTV